jgi:hypothetical protein
MFGNRKRKPDDDEYLVPHGLIWHATAEPTPEENEKNQELLGHTVQFAQGIESARRQELASEPEQRPKEKLTTPTPAPAPIPWWRLPAPEAEPDRPISKPILLPLSEYVSTQLVEPEKRRTAPLQPIRIDPVLMEPTQLPADKRPAEISGGRTADIVEIPEPKMAAPMTQGSLARALELSRPQITETQVQNSEVRKISPAVPKTNPVAEITLHQISRLQSSGKAVWVRAVWGGGRVREGCLRAAHSIQFRQAILRTKKHCKDLMHVGVASSRRYAQATGSTLTALGRTSLARLQRISARINSDFRAHTTTVVRPAKVQFSRPSRVRLQMAASTLHIRIVAAQALAKWKMKRDQMAIDSRFWTSMTLSAIVALIALAIVSLVPRYAAKSLPSKILNTNSSLSASEAAPAAAPLPYADKTAARKTKSTQPAQAKTASTAAATPAKPRRQSNDDYVAPDSYKYYGNGSKTSR